MHSAYSNALRHLVNRRALSADEVAQSYQPLGYGIALDHLSDRLNLMTAGERYSAEAIETMKASVAQAKEDLKAEGADRTAVYAAVMDEYEEFMEGTPANLSFHVVSDLHTSSDASLNLFETALADMNTVNPDAKAILLAGDLPQNGKPEEMTKFYEKLVAGLGEETEGVFVCMGNQEMRGPTSSQWEDRPEGVNAHYPIISASCLENNGKYMGEQTDKVYYD